MRMIATHKKWIRILAVLVLMTAAGMAVWAMRKQLFAGAPQTTGGNQETWTVVNTDPWQELDKLVDRLQKAIPYRQTGSLLLRDEKGALVEEKEFSMAYYDATTAAYTLADIEIMQTVGWQATIDHNRQMVVVNAVQSSQAAMPLQLDISKLKQAFTENSFNWKVMQNETGQRMLVSEDYSNGAITGMKLHYELSSMTITYADLGLPKMVEKTDTQEEDSVPVKEVVSENIRIQYRSMETVNKGTEDGDPRNCFALRNKKLVVLNKRFENYHLINSIQ
jgi:hypothetical protein